MRVCAFSLRCFLRLDDVRSWEWSCCSSNPTVDGFSFYYVDRFLSCWYFWRERKDSLSLCPWTRSVASPSSVTVFGLFIVTHSLTHSLTHSITKMSEAIFLFPKNHEHMEYWRFESRIFLENYRRENCRSPCASTEVLNDGCHTNHQIQFGVSPSLAVGFWSLSSACFVFVQRDDSRFCD